MLFTVLSAVQKNVHFVFYALHNMHCWTGALQLYSTITWSLVH